MQEYKMFSYFGRINYTLMDRYLFEANFRADASSRFYADNRWGYFPSASIAWRLEQEEFMKSLKWLSQLKLRLSYGITGNQSIDPYSTFAMYGGGSIIYADKLGISLQQPQHHP